MTLNDGDRVIIIIACAVFITLGLRLAYLVIRGEQPVKVRKVETIRLGDNSVVRRDSYQDVIEQFERCGAITRAQVQAEKPRPPKPNTPQARGDAFASRIERNLPEI